MQHQNPLTIHSISQLFCAIIFWRTDSNRESHNPSEICLECYKPTESFIQLQNPRTIHSNQS
jgi:hypothetical protein